MSYDLNKIKAPHVAGMAMQAFTLALENAGLRAALLPKLLRDAGFEAFRDRRLSEQPSVVPQIARNQSVPDVALTTERPEGPQGSTPEGSFDFLTCHDFTTAYLAGQSSPEQVAQRVLQAIDQGDSMSPPMRTMIASHKDDVMEQARNSADRYRDGKVLGPLDGVPIAVKDETDQFPYPTTLGTSFMNNPVAADSTVVRLLREAGALLIGKANMHEIGLGVTGLNPHHGTARNPYHPDHHTGGSSSGSAAAVASGLCPIAIGADGGGSIRIPASLCGAVGLKATYGRISEHGVPPLCWSVAHLGPIAATARDCAIAYLTIAGEDPNYLAGVGQPAAHTNDFNNLDLKGLNIGIYEPWFEDAEPDIVSSCREMIDHLTGLGAQVIAIEIPELELARLAHTVSITAEMNTAMESHYLEDSSRFGLDVRTNLALARTFTAIDYVRAQQARTRFSAILSGVLSEVDVIASPSTGITAPAIHPGALSHGESNLPVLGELMRFAFPANLSGLPAISFPCGYNAQGLPIGIQFMAAAWQEHLLLRLAHAGEAATLRAAPRVHFPLL